MKFRFEVLYKKFVAGGVVALILSLPLAFVLPLEWSFENSLIENLQVVVLTFAALLNFCLALRSDGRLKWFHIFCAMGFVLAALRELSWGRVFFFVEMEPLGPIFVDMEHYAYRTQVQIFWAVFTAAMLFILIRYVPVKKLLLGRQPLALLALAVAAIFLEHVGDRGLVIGKLHGQILEELNELILYATLPIFSLYWRGKLQREKSRSLTSKK